MQRLFLTRDHLGTKEDLLPSMIAKHMGWCAISRLQLLWFAVRDGSQQDSPVPMSSSTASHHSRATADEGQPEAGRRQRALPDGRQNQCCRDLVACRHLSGTSTCEDRHFQDSQGQERPEVGPPGGRDPCRGPVLQACWRRGRLFLRVQSEMRRTSSHSEIAKKSRKKSRPGLPDDLSRIQTRVFGLSRPSGRLFWPAARIQTSAFSGVSF